MKFAVRYDLCSMPKETTTEFQKEVRQGQRFEFGKNWQQFLRELTEERIQAAAASLKSNLEVETFRGLTFLDVGCGSGLFSLAAHRLGALVHSLDYDPHSVACALELRRRYGSEDLPWTIEQGSALDPEYLGALGTFDVVYSWGVLHHTGSMWAALENMVPLVAPRGKLYIAIYNDQGTASRRWLAAKKLYNGKRWLRPVLSGLCLVHVWWRPLVKDVLQGRPGHSWRDYRRRRGMSPWRDVVDWIGGYPFEVAKPEEILQFYRARGFVLEKLKTCGGSLACNEYVFTAGG